MGSLLQIVSYGFQLPDGQTLEGVGVTPDVMVEADWLAYPEAEDPFLLAALEVFVWRGRDAERRRHPADARGDRAGRIEVAGHLVATVELDQRRHHSLAGAGDGHRAARCEGTTWRQVARIGRLTTDHRALP